VRNLRSGKVFMSYPVEVQVVFVVPVDSLEKI